MKRFFSPLDAAASPAELARSGKERTEGEAMAVMLDSPMRFQYPSGATPLEGYTIKRGVGLGGFGEVYFALSDAGKEVALKRVQRNLEVELRGVAQCLNLKHPHLVSLYDIRRDAAHQAWVVMEYVAGPNLREVLDRHPQGVGEAEARRWLAGIAAGLSHLHAAGIVHRDMKPGNVFDDDGIIKVGDYGLSKYISCSRRGGHTESVGTFHYMAPEVGRGEYGRQIDLYALGVMLCELLTGQVPFDGETHHEIVMKHLTADPDLSGIAEPYRGVIAWALEKDPAARPTTIAEMLRPLGIEFGNHEPIHEAHYVSAAPAPHGAGAHTAADEARRTAAAAAEQARQTAAAAADEARRTAAAAAEQARGTASAAPPHGPASHAFAPASAPPGAAGGVVPPEPIAQAIGRGTTELRQWWDGMEGLPGTRVLIAVLIGWMLFINVGWVLPMLSVLAILYVPYYILWQLVPRVDPAPPFAEANRMAAAQRARPRPPSIKQWRAARRRLLAEKPNQQRLAEVVASCSTAAVVILVLAASGMLVHVAQERSLQPSAVAPIFAAAVAALWGSFAILGMTKSWEAQTVGKPIRRRLMLAAVGAGWGLVALLTCHYFFMASLPSGAVVLQQTFGSANLWARWPAGAPVVVHWMLHGALLLGMLRWGKLTDPLRRCRLSVWAILWAVAAQWLISQFLPVPQPFGVMAAAMLAIALQIAAPREDPRQRLAAVPTG